MALLLPQLSPAQTGEERVVELPPLIISAAAKEPLWRYAETADLEILSSCHPSLTRNFAQRRTALREMLHVLLPERFLAKSSAPWTLILVSEAHLDAASQEVAEELVRAEGRRQIHEQIQSDVSVRLSSTSSGFYNTADMPPPKPAAPPEPQVRFLPNLRIADRDSGATFSIIREWEFKSADLRLASDQIRFLLEQRTPPLPRWFIDGILGLYEDIHFQDRALALPAFAWSPASELTQLRKHLHRPAGPAGSGVLLSMADLFQHPRPVDPTAAEIYSRKRRLQAALFIRWCLEPKDPTRKQALWNIVDHAIAKPVTEAVFERHFGIGYKGVEAELAAYLANVASRRPLRLRTTASTAPPVEVRPASPTEIARLLGEWERVVIGYVQTHHPEYADKYIAQAYRTVMRAHKSGGRDARLSAVIGLLECDLGNRVEAQPFLEAAAQERIPRPRVYLELARIRLAAALTESRASEANPGLPVAQTAQILALLFAARDFAPPLPEVYELVAEAWEHSIVPPRRDHLTVLEEGIRLFPRRASLVYRTATLYAKTGFAKEARALAELGLMVTAATDGELPFHELLAKLDDAR